jgi:uncharacterized membrane protein YeaQ/YmgE (transglycosylase-associated protein family)
MSIIAFIIIGGIIGYVASRLMGRHEGFLASILIGIVGSFIGSFIGQLFNSGGSYTSMRASGIIWSLIGSVVLVAIMNAMQGRSHHHAM